MDKQPSKWPREPSSVPGAGGKTKETIDDAPKKKMEEVAMEELMEAKIIRQMNPVWDEIHWPR